ncbi:hypothetical protein GCM10010096_22330 [Alcaligenes pakistanensis]|uniref:Uncharacterized protein n=1 Tax=Alcaligenes pakistanensis TaxID=1482717 RepID=A0A8H9IKZ1_9BURK|nr:hypothetical protein GCM10010096_22330 [Alcaligenes pakistanensis]
MFGIELQERIVPLVSHNVTTGNYLCRRPSAWVDTACGQYQIALSHHLRAITHGMLQKAQIVLSAQFHRIKTKTRDLRLAILQGIAIGPKRDPVGNIQNTGLYQQMGVFLQLHHLAHAAGRVLNKRGDILVASGSSRTRQIDMGRGQLDGRAWKGTRGQGNFRHRQMQALPQRQVHTRFNRQNAIGQQGQIIKTACLDTIYTNTGMTILQASIRLARQQIRREILQLLLAHQRHFTMCQHTIARSSRQGIIR